MDPPPLPTQPTTLPTPTPTLTQTQTQPTQPTQTQPQESTTPTAPTPTPFQTPLPKLRLMCSYNGQIIPRPNTKLLCYLGGDTRMISIDRSTTISDVLSRLAFTLNTPTPFSIKYQLPGEDLDSLISLSTDEDLDNMVDEYDRLNSNTNPKPGRIRLFLFPGNGSQSGPDVSDDWFLNAINGAAYSDPGTGMNNNGNNADCLIGLDVETVPDCKAVVEKGVVVGVGQDVQSVPDSKTSSFGSTSSTPTPTTILGNGIGNGGCLPMIKVHVEGGNGNGGGNGIEEQFGQMSVGNNDGNGQVQKVVVVDEGFGRVDSSCQTIVNGFSGGEFDNRVYLEDVKQHQQQQQQQLGMKPQLGTDLPSPDSVSSDNSLSGSIPRQKPVVYQDPNGQLSSGSTRFPSGIQSQQVSESGYPLHPQYDPHQQIIFQPQQLHQQQNFLQQQPQTQPQTQPQYIPAGPHFVHHPPPGAVPMPMPMPAYYPIFPPLPPPHHHPHHYPVYYVPAPGYGLSGQQQQPIPAEAPTSIPSTRTQLPPPNPTIIASTTYNPPKNMNMEPPKSEMGPGSLVQVSSSVNQPSSQSQPQSQPQLQHQFVGYSQIHHPSQSATPSSGAVPSYAYEYYTQPQTPTPAGSQYQGVVSSGPTMMMTEVSSHLSNDSVKQQTRSSQPL